MARPNPARRGDGSTEPAIDEARQAEAERRVAEIRQGTRWPAPWRKEKQARMPGWPGEAKMPSLSRERSDSFLQLRVQHAPPGARDGAGCSLVAPVVDIYGKVKPFERIGCCACLVDEKTPRREGFYNSRGCVISGD